MSKKKSKNRAQKEAKQVQNASNRVSSLVKSGSEMLAFAKQKLSIVPCPSMCPAFAPPYICKPNSSETGSCIPKKRATQRLDGLWDPQGIVF